MPYDEKVVVLVPTFFTFHRQSFLFQKWFLLVFILVFLNDMPILLLLSLTVLDIIILIILPDNSAL